MKHPYNLEPMPTDEQLDQSPLGVYYFGFYVKDHEIREYALKYHKREINSSRTSALDLRFMIRSLSQFMEGDYALRWKCVIVTQEHKDAFPEIEEAVGEDAYIAVILSTNDYFVGYHPSNREVIDLSKFLKREPYWWPACD